MLYNCDLIYICLVINQDIMHVIKGLYITLTMDKVFF